MTGIEFCEGCPMRGEVQGEIEGHLTLDIGYTRRYGLFGQVAGIAERFNVGVYVDEDLNPSEIITMPKTEEGQGRMAEKIVACEKPLMHREGLFKRRQVPVSCPAIGDLALTDLALKEKLTPAIRLALLDVPAMPDQE